MSTPTAKRTAVLVVHGMGNQRPLETMRGVFEAVWLKNEAVKPRRKPGTDDPSKAANEPEKLYWMHPDRLTREVDLSVLTTDNITPEARRRFDFHELYWAHWMTGTPALAVMLWLFALIRRGPRARGFWLKAAWVLAAPFVAITCAAAIFLMLTVVQAITPAGAFAQIISGYTLWLTTAIAIGVFIMVTAGAGLGLVLLLAGVGAAFVVLLFADKSPASLLVEYSAYTTLLIVPVLAFLFSTVVMRVWGVMALLFGFIIWYVAWGRVWSNWDCAWPWSTPNGALPDTDKPCLAFWLRVGPWSLDSVDMVWGAFTVLAIYVLLNAFFLQTVLGDAARYFRNTPSNVAVRRAIRRHALETLEGLHRDERYDRVIVVAHSLGTVVAYDMLRAYWSRVNKRIAVSGDVRTTADALQRLVDGPIKAAWKDRSDTSRWNAREPRPEGAEELRAKLGPAQDDVMRAIGRSFGPETRAAWLSDLNDKTADLETSSPPTWKVTDFVTLGSPLTHGAYLLADEDDAEKGLAEFEQRKSERTFPTATARLDRISNGDGSLIYSTRGERYFHHAALFGLTRWTNVYFRNRRPWRPGMGDPIGGPLRDVFGWAIDDVEIDYSKPGASRWPALFEHTSYWDGEPDHEHMQALCKAMRLDFDMQRPATSAFRYDMPPPAKPHPTE